MNLVPRNSQNHQIWSEIGEIPSTQVLMENAIELKKNVENEEEDDFVPEMEGNFIN